MVIFMRILGAIFLVISVHTWLCVFVPAWYAAFRWRWRRGPVAGRVTHAAFGLMFGSIGAAVALGDWLIPREFLIGFAALWVAGFLLSIVGGRLDQKAEQARNETVGKDGYNDIDPRQ
jgi:hypothetical protein